MVAGGSMITSKVTSSGLVSDKHPSCSDVRIFLLWKTQEFCEVKFEVLNSYLARPFLARIRKLIKFNHQWEISWGRYLVKCYGLNIRASTAQRSALESRREFEVEFVPA